MEGFSLKITNLDKTVTLDDLNAKIHQYNFDPVSVTIRTWSADKSYGYGRVYTRNTTEANRIVTDMNGKVVEGNELKVVIQHDDVSQTIVYVGNVPVILGEDGFKALFEQYRPKNVEFILTKAGDSKGIADVVLKDYLSVLNFDARFNNYKIGNQKISFKVPKLKKAKVEKMEEESESQKQPKVTPIDDENKEDDDEDNGGFVDPATLADKEEKKEELLQQRKKDRKSQRIKIAYNKDKSAAKKEKRKQIGCFICQQQGHTSQDCPYKDKKIPKKAEKKSNNKKGEKRSGKKGKTAHSDDGESNE
ncbi:hypothetical protein EIN_335400 [Entamoeba invadens IP1]|uniref:CCHC-type domain-containing protein n=1 Tax=Entamoeba invadens IP1 TaxID=370355 RepID=L7FLB5_ENTIV|nr:hypothetical protein EIN_335400 [Entamoeba invadens IP1]ELP88558.1 hypothetical protein EIN_335400 [Entamoeba invadens IP1]|eukprot:XP_004255329.1 hypothetical protein EIN_335400 [Entamoeba invadens IP1]